MRMILTLKTVLLFYGAVLALTLYEFYNVQCTEISAKNLGDINNWKQ